jgi:hypothetical protein
MYLVEAEDPAQDPKPPAELRTNDPCAVGDVILTPVALSSDRRRLCFAWKITARTATEDPFAARLTVVPAALGPDLGTRSFG